MKLSKHPTAWEQLDYIPISFISHLVQLNSNWSHIPKLSRLPSLKAPESHPILSVTFDLNTIAKSWQPSLSHIKQFAMASAAETNPDKLPTPSPTNPNQLNAACHCRRTMITIPAPPTKLNECRCTICYQYGALWAYYPRNEVTVTAEEPGLRSYVREDDDGSGDIGFYTCGHCGVLTHWWGQQGTEKRGGDSAKMGVNARIMGEKIVEGCERKIGRK